MLEKVLEELDTMTDHCTPAAHAHAASSIGAGADRYGDRCIVLIQFLLYLGLLW